MKNLWHVVRLVVCIGLITAFTGCAATQKHESTGEYLDDSVITSKVKTNILAESSLKVLQIKVETYKGEVQLSGFVDSQQNAQKAEEIAKSVSGVKSVKNSLVVK